MLGAGKAKLFLPDTCCWEFWWRNGVLYFLQLNLTFPPSPSPSSPYLLLCLALGFHLSFKFLTLFYSSSRSPQNPFVHLCKSLLAEHRFLRQSSELIPDMMFSLIHLVLFCLASLGWAQMDTGCGTVSTPTTIASCTLFYIPSMPPQIGPTCTVYATMMTTQFNVVNCKVCKLSNVAENPVPTVNDPSADFGQGSFHHQDHFEVPAHNADWVPRHRMECLVCASCIRRTMYVRSSKHYVN